MSIYDKALKELNEYAQYNGIDFEIPRKAFERAKKERKLLDMYREQSNAFMDEDFTKAIILQNDIDILEEKLKG